MSSGDVRSTSTKLWKQVESDGRFDLSTSPLFADVSQRFGFASGRASHDDCIATIRDVDAHTGIVVDPHTAVAVKVAREHAAAGVPMVVLETAKPAKFAETIREALGRDAEVPARFADLLDRPQKSSHLVADPQAVKDYIVARTQSA